MKANWKAGTTALAIATVSVILAREAKPPVPLEEPRPPAAVEVPKPSITLPTLGTVVLLSPRSERLFVDVDARGRIFVEGKALSMAEFEGLLKDRGRPRQAKGERQHLLFVVLRVDRDLPWQAAQWLVQTCTEPGCYVYRLWFGAHPEDEGACEAAVAFFPRIEVGFRDREARASLVPVSVDLAFGETEATVAPADLYSFLRTKHAELDGKKTAFEISASPSVPTGDVLAAADAAIRHGAQSVFLEVCRIDRGKRDLPEAVAALPPRRGGLVLTVLGTRVPPPGKDDPRMPPVLLKKGLLPPGGDLSLVIEDPEIEIEPEGPDDPRLLPPEKPR